MMPYSPRTGGSAHYSPVCMPQPPPARLPEAAPHHSLPPHQYRASRYIIYPAYTPVVKAPARLILYPPPPKAYAHPEAATSGGTVGGYRQSRPAPDLPQSAARCPLPALQRARATDRSRGGQSHVRVRGRRHRHALQFLRGQRGQHSALHPNRVRLRLQHLPRRESAAGRGDES
jgi:hypothetical protein